MTHSSQQCRAKSGTPPTPHVGGRSDKDNKKAGTFYEPTGSLDGTNGDPSMKRKIIPERNGGDTLPQVESLDMAGHGMEHESEDVEIISLKDRIRQRKMEVERSVLIQTLRKTGGNKAEAARLLQINYSTIHLKIKRYGIRKVP